MLGFCEDCNGHSGSVKDAEFLDSMRALASEQGLCSMQLVIV
jgi:hypothetical protein